jgi:hypothetical protein
MLQRLLVIALALIGFSTAAFAQDTAPAERTMGPLYITKGHAEVGGGGYYQTAAEGSGWILDLNPKVEYFILNRFSVGGTVRYVDGSLIDNTVEIGPSVTYYLTHTSNWAVSVDQSIRYALPEEGDNYIAGETGLAFDYFFTESIALGPEVKALYFFNGDDDAPGDATRFLVNFSLFL